MFFQFSWKRMALIAGLVVASLCVTTEASARGRKGCCTPCCYTPVYSSCASSYNTCHHNGYYNNGYQNYGYHHNGYHTPVSYNETYCSTCY